MKMDIDNICIALQKSNNKFDDQMEFFENNYNKVFMTMGEYYCLPVSQALQPRLKEQMRCSPY
jgi:hypothetical protein